MQQRLRRTYSHVEEDDVVSLEESTRHVLVQLMAEEDRLHVVSIVGMGGIGKTTLARKVYNHIDVKRHFDCCAWAFISQQCRPTEVLQDLLIKLLPGEQNDDKLVETQLVKRLYDGLKEKRYLIVFDDVWKSDDWDKFKPAFPKGKKGSKILFTTRHKNVALHADPCNSPIELSFLTDDESWKLFKTKAFPGNKTESHACPEELEMPGRDMVKKCGGLPLAIAVLGGLLATKKTRAEWEMVQRNINAHLNNFPLQEDWEISKEELIRLWIAEGFISPSWESREGMLMEEVAERFLEELIDRCLVQVGRRDYTGTSVKTCRIHDLLRDLCARKAEKENFLKIIQPSLMENDDHVNLTPSMARIIAVHPSKRYVVLNGNHPNLRSLLFFQAKLMELNISKCNDFKFLRVLNLVRNEVDRWHVSNEIGNLCHLRYLKLRVPKSGGVILPRSIGKLKNLHTLDIFDLESSIPHVLFKWRRLRHVIVNGLSIEDANLLGRDILKNMETLKNIRGKSLNQNNAVFDLTNVRSLKIYFERLKDVQLIVKALTESQRLRSLYMGFSALRSVHSVSSPDLEPLSHCHHLSKLSLRGVIREDPQSSHHVLNFLPASIVQLTLERSYVKQDPMAVLGKLRHLRTLRLWTFSYKGTKMVCSANDFLQLDFLSFHELCDLEEWQIEEGTMPRLRSLSLSLIPNLRTFPEGLRYVTALQEMQLCYLKRSLVERIQVIDGREGEDFSKVRHIPSIRMTPMLRG
ncbi:probable disease resistance protein At1g58602 isoform X2 [Herrania umbratica]|uniref:Probable disease resistance protein At1g58602 isoform X2 n=1 Tax=Herrania umbratica TaxID=108875 RepID=A0A6J1B9D8_9ROSI|nr:probable disease resistance protein At1g58602 isoform X2 [Herrania umbratica]